MNVAVLCYLYKGMLRDERNEAEVLDILRRLEVDIRPAGAEETGRLLRRLKELGEDRIYSAASESFERLLK